MEKIKEELESINKEIEKCIEKTLNEDYNIGLKKDYKYYIDECIKSLNTYLLMTKKEILENIIQNGIESINYEKKKLLEKIENNENKNTKLYQVSSIEEVIDLINLIINYDNIRFLDNLADE